MKEDVLRFREVYNIWEGRGLDPELLQLTVQRAWIFLTPYNPIAPTGQEVRYVQVLLLHLYCIISPFIPLYWFIYHKKWHRKYCTMLFSEQQEKNKDELYKKQGWERVETTKWTYYSLVFRINNRGKSAWKPQNGLITVSLSSDDMVNNNLYMGRNSTIRYWSQVDLWILFGCEF